MSTANNTNRKATVSLNLPRRIAALILFATSIVEKMTGNPNFQAPTPALAVLTAAILALSTSETAALSRAKGAATVRNDKRAAVVTLLRQLGAYVQGVATASPDNGAAIIQSAGFDVRKIPVRSRRAFAAKHGPLSGSVVVTAVTAGDRSSYEWGYTLDGGKTWIQTPSTVQGTTTITGIAPGTTAMFRYRTVTPKGGQGDWTQPVALIVQ